MRFFIYGADRATGKDVRLTVEADSPQDAAAQANDQGVLVADIKRLDEPAPPSGPPEVAAYRAYMRKPPRKKYMALRIVAMIYTVLAWICLGLTALYLLFFVFAIVTGLTQAESVDDASLWIAGGMIGSIATIVFGFLGWLFLMSLAESIRVFIDIEHNLRQTLRLMREHWA